MAAKLIGERLPPNWSYGVSRDGRIFFINDNACETTWLHPVTGEPVQTGHTHVEGLPPGWEQALTIDGSVYFIDHNSRRTTFDHPGIGRPMMEPPLRSPPQTPNNRTNTNRKSMKGSKLKAPTATREENSKVIMRGWLQKQESGGLKLWKKKWAVVADYGLFFYKDDSEQTCIGSILLPSYYINPCTPTDVNKKYAFKAEHENMKTFYFATDNQYDMDKWLEALRMASLVQKAPGSGQMQKLIPKSPIMSWTDTIDSPGVSPPDMQNYPFSGRESPHSERDGGFRDRSPLRPRENTQDYTRNPSNRQYNQDPNRSSYSMGYPDPNRSYQDPERSFNQDPNMSYRESERGSQRGSRSNIPMDRYGSLPRGQPGQQGQPFRTNDPNAGRQFDPRLHGDRSERGSVRSTQSQGRLPADQRSRSGDPRSHPGPYTSSTLPRDMRYGNQDNRGQQDSRGQEPHRGQQYNSLPREPRDSRSKLSPGDNFEGPFSQSSPRQPAERGSGRRKEDNPYMMMTSPQGQMKEKKMDPSRHSNRPLPQEPPPEPIHDRSQSGGGDYASLTRIKERWPNQNLSKPVNEDMIPQSSQGGALQAKRPDLYVDIPPTYVNVFDQSQIRDQPPELPSRPPLPVEMRPKIVADLAMGHSPNTQRAMLEAEHNLEQRMKQPPFFNYPTPTRESLPPLPQDSPRSHYSQRSQRSNDPRSRLADDSRGHQPNRPNQLAPLSSNVEAPVVRLQAGPTYQAPNQYDPDVSDNTDNLNGSDNTLTNEDRNDRISEFYGLGKYNEKNGTQGNKNRIMSDMDVRANTLPVKRPVVGVTGEKDFRMRSLPDHAQSMPAIYHEQQPGNMSARGDERKSAFRPLSSASNSLQRLSNPDHNPLPPGHQEDYSKLPVHPDPHHTDIKRLSAASSQMSQPRSSWKQDNLPGQLYPGQGQGQYQPESRGQRMGQRSGPAAIHTVKEDPDMPDSQVIATDLPKRNFLLNGPRLRMSISATDLLGKTHDELVLLLIQLRRDKADLNTQRDGLRKTIEQSRPAEFYYRKQQNEGRPIDPEKEQQHRKYVDMKRKLEDVEKRLEVYKPLVNLVCNMVTMGSLYGGDNLMLATEYRKHLLSPEQYSPPKKMLEFSRKYQEDQVVQEIEDDVKQLTKEQADLEEKLDRLYELDRVMQDQSFQVTSLREDKEMLEKALGGLLKKQDQNGSNPVELDKLRQQQRTVEKELSRVLQQLAECSKELEETTAENNRVEHEVALLRSKVHGDVSRSKSAPSLSSESLRTKMKMEKDLAKVQDIMEGLSERGSQLQEMMNTLRRPQKGGDSQKPLSPLSPFSTVQKGTDQTDSKSGLTYFETDLDSSETKDLAQVTALLASYKLIPGQETGDLNQEPLTFQTSSTSYGAPPPSNEEGTSAFRTVSPGRKEEDPTFHASPVQTFLNQTTAPANTENGLEADRSPDQWDIGDADDNTKRFYGLIPKNMPKSQTVRDVKRHSGNRKKKEDDPPPLRVGIIPSETSDYTDSNFPVYENLPQTKSAPISDPSSVSAPWASVASEENIPSGNQRRRSLLHLMTPKPFTKTTQYSSVNNVSTPHNNPETDQSDSFLNTQIIQPSQSKDLEQTPYDFESSLLNTSNTSADPVMQITNSKTPPPPPVRGTSKRIAMENFAKPNMSFMSSFRSQGQTTGNEIPPPPRNYVLPEPAILNKKSPKNSRAINKDRYLTISSSQPVKLEKNLLQSPKLNSQAGDLISSVPDIVKSSTSQMDQIDERTIDRAVLFYPEKVEIPERYIPDSDDESVTEEEKEKRREKANKIKKILTQQSVHSLSQPDVSKVAGEVHQRVQQEKQKRAHLLGISQELAEEVKKKSRQFAAERRKTWSGSPQKPTSFEDNSVEFGDGNQNYLDDPNNNSYASSKDDSALAYTDNRSYDQTDSLYDHHGHSNYGDSYYDTNYTKGDISSSYMDTDYNSTSYNSQPNFKI